MGKHFDSKDLQNYQKENEGSADSGKKIAEGQHQARADADKADELPERRDSKVSEGEKKLASDAMKGSNSSK